MWPTTYQQWLTFLVAALWPVMGGKAQVQRIKITIQVLCVYQTTGVRGLICCFTCQTSLCGNVHDSTLTHPTELALLSPMVTSTTLTHLSRPEVVRSRPCWLRHSLTRLHPVGVPSVTANTPHQPSNLTCKCQPPLSPHMQPEEAKAVPDGVSSCICC